MARSRRTPAQRSRRFENNRLITPTIDWNSPPEQFRFPETADLKKMEPAQLGELLERFGVSEPWPQLKAAAAGYVQRMSTLPPGSEAFSDEVDRLTDASSKRGALGMTRRAYREFSTMDAMDGDVDTELIWITEGDESTCNRCRPRGGDIGTIQEHAAKGLPGASTCAGGDMCRCVLTPIL